MADTYWTLHKAPPSSPKKWAVRVPTSSGRGKTVLFGARGYEDFTTHGDVERRERYRIRHQHDRIDDPYAPGFWSMWALWGESDDLKTAFAAAVRKAKSALGQARRNYENMLARQARRNPSRSPSKLPRVVVRSALRGDSGHPEAQQTGDKILVFPKFFDRTKDQKVFILLHELGHWFRQENVELADVMGFEPGEGFFDLFGAGNSEEGFADAFATMLYDEGELKKRYPKPYQQLHAWLRGHDVEAMIQWANEAAESAAGDD